MFPLLFLFLIPITLAGKSSVNIKWDFKDRSLREVLKEVADVYEIGFVFSDDIVDHVRITCHIEDLTFREAVALILKEANLDYQLLPHQVMVITPKDEHNFQLPKEVLILHAQESIGVDSLQTFQAIFPEQIMRETTTHSSLGISGICQPIQTQRDGKGKTTRWIGKIDKKLSWSCGEDHDIDPPDTPTDLLPLLRQASGSTGVMDDLKANSSDVNRAVTLDGIPLYHQTHIPGILSSLSREAVSSVEYLPAPWDQELNFGITGLIRMETPPLRPDSLAYSLRIHTLGINASAALSPRKDFQTLITYRRSYPKQFSSDINPGFERLMWIARENADLSDLESSAFNYHDLTAKCQISAIPNMPVWVTVFDTRDQSDAADQTGAFGNLHETFANTGFGLGTEYFWNLCHQTQFDLAYSLYENEASYANPFYSSNAYRETDRIAHLNVNLKDQWLLAPEWRLDLKAGLNRQEMGHDFRENGLLREAEKINTQLHSALHVGWLSHSGSEWNAEVNLKYSALQEAVYVEPVLSWTCYFSPDACLGIEYIRNIQDVIRLPHAFYTPIPKLTKDFWVVPDSPAMSNNLAIRGLTTLFGWNLNGQIRFHRTSNMPCLLPEAKIETLSARQDFYEDGTGFGETKGAEFSGTAAKGYGHFEATASYHFQYQKNQFDDLNNGKPFPSANRLHQANLRIRYNSNAWQLSASYTLASGNKYSKVDPESVITPLGADYWPHVNESQDVNTFQLPWYNRLDLGASYCFRIRKSAHVKLGIFVLNVLNQKNIIAPYHYELNSGNPQVIQNTRGLGRTGLMFLEISF